MVHIGCDGQGGLLGKMEVIEGNDMGKSVQIFEGWGVFGENLDGALDALGFGRGGLDRRALGFFEGCVDRSDRFIPNDHYV